MRWTITILMMAAMLAGRAEAADLTVVVKTARGEPVRDAVVTIQGAGGARATAPLEMNQRNLQFDPFVLVVPLGAEVAFPNRDPVRHHVYSFSPAKRFELKLYARGEAPKVKFDKPGVVAVGCNIHDSMVAFIKVVDTPFAAKTEASGAATLRGVPAGPVTVRVWHPYLRGANNEVVRQLTLADGSNTDSETVEIRTPIVHHGAY